MTVSISILSTADEEHLEYYLKWEDPKSKNANAEWNIDVGYLMDLTDMDNSETVLTDLKSGKKYKLGLDLVPFS